MTRKVDRASACRIVAKPRWRRAGPIIGCCGLGLGSSGPGRGIGGIPDGPSVQNLGHSFEILDTSYHGLGGWTDRPGSPASESGGVCPRPITSRVRPGAPACGSVPSGSRPTLPPDDPEHQRANLEAPARGASAGPADLETPDGDRLPPHTRLPARRYDLRATTWCRPVSRADMAAGGRNGEGREGCRAVGRAGLAGGGRFRARRRSHE